MNYFFSLFQTNTLHLTKTQSGSRIVHTMTLQREAEKGNKKSVIKIKKKHFYFVRRDLFENYQKRLQVCGLTFRSVRALDTIF